MARRWFRLDVGWSRSEWLADLEPAARLAWVELLGYTKAEGVGGRVKALTAKVFGRMVGLDAADVQAMLEAAREDGSLSLDNGSWVVVKWREYQEIDATATERKRRQRSRDVTDVTRDKPESPSRDHRPPTETYTTQHISIAGARLREWLGEHSGSVDRFERCADHPPGCLDGLLMLYGEGGTDARVWGGLPPPERPQLMAIALDRFAAEGKQYSGAYFRAFLQRVVNEHTTGTNGKRAPSETRSAPARAGPTQGRPKPERRKGFGG